MTKSFLPMRTVLGNCNLKLKTGRDRTSIHRSLLKVELVPMMLDRVESETVILSVLLLCLAKNE